MSRVRAQLTCFPQTQSLTVPAAPALHTLVTAARPAAGTRRRESEETRKLADLHRQLATTHRCGRRRRRIGEGPTCSRRLTQARRGSLRPARPGQAMGVPCLARHHTRGSERLGLCGARVARRTRLEASKKRSGFCFLVPPRCSCTHRAPRTWRGAGLEEPVAAQFARLCPTKHHADHRRLQHCCPPARGARQEERLRHLRCPQRRQDRVHGQVHRHPQDPGGREEAVRRRRPVHPRRR